MLATLRVVGCWALTLSNMSFTTRSSEEPGMHSIASTALSPHPQEVRPRRAGKAVLDAGIIVDSIGLRGEDEERRTATSTGDTCIVSLSRNGEAIQHQFVTDI